MAIHVKLAKGKGKRMRMRMRWKPLHGKRGRIDLPRSSSRSSVRGPVSARFFCATEFAGHAGHVSTALTAISRIDGRRSVEAWRIIILDAVSSVGHLSVSCGENMAATNPSELEADQCELARNDTTRLYARSPVIVDALAIAAGLDGTLWFYASTGDLARAVDEVSARLAGIDFTSPHEPVATSQPSRTVCNDAIAEAIAIVDKHLQRAELKAY